MHFLLKWMFVWMNEWNCHNIGIHIFITLSIACLKKHYLSSFPKASISKPLYFTFLRDVIWTAQRKTRKERAKCSHLQWDLSTPLLTSLLPTYSTPFPSYSLFHLSLPWLSSVFLCPQCLPLFQESESDPSLLSRLISICKEGRLSSRLFFILWDSCSCFCLIMAPHIFWSVESSSSSWSPSSSSSLLLLSPDWELNGLPGRQLDGLRSCALSSFSEGPSLLHRRPGDR